MHFVKIVTTIIATLAFSSCNYNINLGNEVNGNGNIVTENRSHSGFQNISVSNGLDCVVKQGAQYDVKVIADENLIKGIKTNVENGTLIISSNYNNYINIKSKKIIVTLPEISSLKASSGSTLKTNGVLKSNNLMVKSSSGSHVMANLEADNINLEASSGSQMEISGKALKLFTDSSSGSSIDADELWINEVNAQSSSGSTTEIHPIVTLQAKASSGSAITYNTMPKNITINESSGASISKD